MLVPTALGIKQPDLGTALVLIVILTAMLFFALPNLLYFGAYVAGLIAASTIAVASPVFLKGYQRRRLLVFLDPSHDPQGSGWSLIQSKIAVGSGQLSGKGLFHGTQTQLGFVPEHATDFIFTVVGEELGFIGASVLFCLFVMLLFRLTRAADMSRDDFGRLLTFGVAAMILFAAVANLGANLTLLPVTVTPLPFISYGRTSLLPNLAALGFVHGALLYRLQRRFCP